MYQIPRAVQGYLFRLEEAHSITRLRVLKASTIAALQKQGISIIEDLLKTEPTELDKIEGISADEKEKLHEVYPFLFRHIHKDS